MFIANGARQQPIEKRPTSLSADPGVNRPGFGDVFSDLPVADLDIQFVDLDFSGPEEVAVPAPRREKSAGRTTASTAAGTSPKSVRITVGVPSAVLAEFKAHARLGGSGYQTLIVRALGEWLTARE